jgi:hypothetical protein
MPYLAKGDITVHRLLSPEVEGQPVATESVILTYGESLEDDQVPGYVKEAVKNGEAPFLEKVTESAAKKAADDVAKEIAEAEENVVDARNSEESFEEDRVKKTTRSSKE